MKVNFYHPQHLLARKPTAPCFASLIIHVTGHSVTNWITWPHHLLGFFFVVCLFVCFKLATLSSFPLHPSSLIPGSGLSVDLSNPVGEAIPTFIQGDAMTVRIFQFQLGGFGEMRKWEKGKLSKSKESYGITTPTNSRLGTAAQYSPIVFPIPNTCFWVKVGSFYFFPWLVVLLFEFFWLALNTALKKLLDAFISGLSSISYSRIHHFIHKTEMVLIFWFSLN